MLIVARLSCGARAREAACRKMQTYIFVKAVFNHANEPALLHSG
jgi:hypothetical protein